MRSEYFTWSVDRQMSIPDNMQVRTFIYADSAQHYQSTSSLGVFSVTLQYAYTEK